MELESVNGKFESQWFNAPTGSATSTLTINAKTGTDDIEIASLSPTFDAALTVNTLDDGFDPFATGLLPGDNNFTHDSVIRVTGDIALHGHALTLIGDTVYVGTVAQQTSSQGSWTANQTYSGAAGAGVAGSGGSGTGATATIVTDDAGNVSARLNHAGTGYHVGDVITFADPTNAAHTVTMTIRNAANAATALSRPSSRAAMPATSFGLQTTNSDGTTAYAGGQYIALGPNASLLAGADTVNKHKPGKVLLATSDLTERPVSWPADFTSKNAAIDLVGATIHGGSVKINAVAKDTNFASDVPAAAAGFTNSLKDLLQTVPGVLISALTGIDVSVILRGANAKISVNDSTIEAEGNVDIKAETKVETQVTAIAAGLGNFSGLEFAAGYGMAKSDVEAKIGGSTEIISGGSVTVSAKGATTSKTVARASSNLISTVNPTSSSVAIAISHTDLTAIASVGNDVTITAAGNVNVLDRYVQDDA